MPEVKNGPEQRPRHERHRPEVSGREVLDLLVKEGVISAVAAQKLLKDKEKKPAGRR